jgi:hypothetical protein
VNYFRLADFKRMFGEVIESGKVFGGQYIYVIVELSSLRIPVIDMNNLVNFPSDFTSNLTEQNRIEQNSATIWSGASKGVIFALLKERAGQPVDSVIDINPAKKGRFLPGTGLLVKSPAQGIADLQNGSTIYVMNSNYLEEIRKISNNMFDLIGIDHD